MFDRTSASLASFEDSNTENEPEAGRARAGSVSRRARVTRASKSVLADVDTEQDKNRQVKSVRLLNYHWLSFVEAVVELSYAIKTQLTRDIPACQPCQLC